MLEQATNREEWRAHLDTLLKGVHPSHDRDLLIRDVIETAATLFQNGVGHNDIKTLHDAFNEMVQALQFFEPYAGIRKISVFGSSRTSPSEPIYACAADFARRMTLAHFMVITGAGDGIMRAVQGGAGRERSFGINILLPFGQEANEYIANDPKLITFKYFFTRKLFFVKEADALAFFPGGFGTHDEGFEALTLLQTGKSDPIPLVFIDIPGGTHWRAWFSYVEQNLLGKGLISPEDLKIFKITDCLEEAVLEMTHFYKHYHSIQYGDDETVIHLNGPLSGEQLTCLNDLFSDILVGGRIVGITPGLEDGESCLYRLLFHFDRKHFGRLREMINTINDFPAGVSE